MPVLDGTEIAISESQERMAVVVDPKDVEEFLDYAKEENLEAVEVAVVTESPRLVLGHGEEKRSSIFPVHSWIPTVHIRRQPLRWRFQMKEDAIVCKRSRAGCKRKMAGDHAERFKCMLPERACGDVRRFYRSRLRIHAAWRKVSDDRDAGYGC